MKRHKREEIADVQCGYTEGKGASNKIFLMRNIIEGSIDIQRDQRLRFIDDSKLSIKSNVINYLLCLIDLTLMKQ